VHLRGGRAADARIRFWLDPQYDVWRLGARHPRNAGLQHGEGGDCSFTNSLARQVCEFRIRVNALTLGMVITPSQRKLWYQDESKVADGLKLQCISEEITVEDVANACPFLASDDSRMITKQMLLINGGPI
jgi:NAD(P)-dependent dehydrogenase (short-subunit alcohol dehydrogenase family)